MRLRSVGAPAPAPVGVSVSIAVGTSLSSESEVTQPQVTKTPRQWAVAKGHLPKPKKAWHAQTEAWEYAAATTLHGWKLHEHHAGVPMQLTEQEYDAAILAVSAATLRPCEKALSPYAPHRGAR